MKAGGKLLVHPAVDLICPKGLFAFTQKFFPKLFPRKRFNVSEIHNDLFPDFPSELCDKKTVAALHSRKKLEIALPYCVFLKPDTRLFLLLP